MASRGRPRKLNTDLMIAFRIDQNTKDALTVLASNWTCTASEAIRRAVRECAKWPEQPPK